jgi:hypothetical protein
MRSHGVPAWPDPFSNQSNIKFGPGPVEAQQFGGSSSHFNAAGEPASTCSRSAQRPVPGGHDAADSERHAERFSRCMRSHGVPTWADPTTNSWGAAHIQSPWQHQPGFAAGQYRGERMPAPAAHPAPRKYSVRDEPGPGCPVTGQRVGVLHVKRAPLSRIRRGPGPGGGNASRSCAAGRLWPEAEGTEMDRA